MNAHGVSSLPVFVQRDVVEEADRIPGVVWYTVTRRQYAGTDGSLCCPCATVARKMHAARNVFLLFPCVVGVVDLALYLL